MRKLIISMKTSTDSLADFGRALKKARKGKLNEDHFELSFKHKKDFDRLVKNIGILSAILVHKPKSIYEVPKLIHMDVSNLYVIRCGPPFSAHQRQNQENWGHNAPPAKKGGPHLIRTPTHLIY